MTPIFEQIAARHGTYWHFYRPGKQKAICGLSRPIFRAKAIGMRDQCPRCRAGFDEAVAALRT